jgi:hypothetical protein
MFAPGQQQYCFNLGNGTGLRPRGPNIFNGPQMKANISRNFQNNNSQLIPQSGMPVQVPFMGCQPTPNQPGFPSARIMNQPFITNLPNQGNQFKNNSGIFNPNLNPAQFNMNMKVKNGNQPKPQEVYFPEITPQPKQNNISQPLLAPFMMPTTPLHASLNLPVMKPVQNTPKSPLLVNFDLTGEFDITPSSKNQHFLSAQSENQGTNTQEFQGFVEKVKKVVQKFKMKGQKLDWIEKTDFILHLESFYRSAHVIKNANVASQIRKYHMKEL